MSVLLISCGGKNDKKDDGKDEITTSESDCNLSELNLNIDIDDYSDTPDYFYTTKDIKKNTEKENFTGIAIEKDQNDSILNRAEIKNGWLIRYTHRKKVDNRYITISDYTLDNGLVTEGYKKVIENEYDPKIEYVEKVCKYKNEKSSKDWEIRIRTNEKMTINGRVDENGNWVGEYITAMNVKNLCPGSKRENRLDILNLKCISNFKKDYEGEKSGFQSDSDYEYDAIKYYENADEKIIFKTLDDMKKELPKFDYWKK